MARDQDEFIFAEVKTRRTGSKGPPEEGLTAAKASRLISVAQTYLQAAGESEADWRIDLIAVELDRVGHPLRVEVIENAVTG